MEVLQIDSALPGERILSATGPEGGSFTTTRSPVHRASRKSIVVTILAAARSDEVLDHRVVIPNLEDLDAKDAADMVCTRRTAVRLRVGTMTHRVAMDAERRSEDASGERDECAQHGQGRRRCRENSPLEPALRREVGEGVQNEKRRDDPGGRNQQAGCANRPPYDTCPSERPPTRHPRGWPLRWH